MFTNALFMGNIVACNKHPATTEVMKLEWTFEPWDAKYLQDEKHN